MTNLTAVEIAEKVRGGDLDPVALAEEALARIAAKDGATGAFLATEPERAREAAAKAKQSRAGSLAGVPIAIKDNICWQGTKTTCASKMLANFRPPYDATVIELLLAEGAVPIGKTNMDEFAMGSSTENSALGVTRNPWDTTRVPGGSSGGSAAAVAAGFCPVALGSDTGGSIRQPASYCGVIGFKPTYGAVSRYGLVAFGSSLDQIGVFARTAADAALVFQAISAPDPRDATCHVAPLEYPAPMPEDAKGLRIGLPEEYFAVEGLDPEVKASVLGAVETLRAAGAEVKSVRLPSVKYAIPTYYIIATAEASSNLARYDGFHYTARADGRDIVEMASNTRGEFFGDEVKRRIMLGTYVLSAGYYDAYYLRALKIRQLIADEFAKVFSEVDLVASPTAPSTAFKAGEKTADPLAMYLSDIYTISANLAGIPGISVPCGADKDGMPIGAQFMAARFADHKLLAAANVLERHTGWRDRVAPGF